MLNGSPVGRVGQFSGDVTLPAQKGGRGGGARGGGSTVFLAQGSRKGMAEAAAGAAATEAAEVGQLDTVLLRLALIETDEKLETVLNGSLPLILNMLSSEHAGTKKKVLEVLGHINKRTAGLGISLPLTALVEQYLDGSVGGFQKNFTLIYIKQAFLHAPLQEQIATAHRLQL